MVPAKSPKIQFKAMHILNHSDFERDFEGRQLCMKDQEVRTKQNRFEGS